MDYQEAPSPAVSAAQKANEFTGVYFAVPTLGMIAIFAVARWHSYLSKVAVHTTRCTRGSLLRKVPFFPSLGHGVIFMLYLIINITLSVYGLDRTSPFAFSKRSGWIAAYNIALVVFLALKNTPLAFLTAYSYERLNCLHQMAGYCTIIFSLLHAIVYPVALYNEGKLSDHLINANIMAIAIGLAMLIMLIGILFLRKRSYEVFYILHISMAMVILVGAGMHRPDITKKTLIIIIFAASIWIADRCLRFARIGWHAVNNSASFRPLAQGGVRVIVSRTPRNAVPGSHVFLWIPKIRAAETHPFTIVSVHPLELVVSAHNGFTKDLLSYASENINSNLRVSVDGPYGTLPNFTTFDQIVLIAGGSGASFGFGVATDLIKKLKSSTGRPVVKFIWVVKDLEILTWYTEELEILHASSLVEMTIHVTRSTPTQFMTTTLDGQVAYEKLLQNLVPAIQHPSLGRCPTYDSDIEKSACIAPPPHSSTRSHALSKGPEIHSGRPDIAELFTRMVHGSKSHERTIVAACGPESLMSTVRSVVADIVGMRDRSVTLHCEQFGW